MASRFAKGGKNGLVPDLSKLTKGEAANIINRLKHGAMVSRSVCRIGDHTELFAPVPSPEESQSAGKTKRSRRKRETTESTRACGSWTAFSSMINISLCFYHILIPP